jgi:hypothetical protein
MGKAIRKSGGCCYRLHSVLTRKRPVDTSGGMKTPVLRELPANPKLAISCQFPSYEWALGPPIWMKIDRFRDDFRRSGRQLYRSSVNWRASKNPAVIRSYSTSMNAANAAAVLL